MLRVSLVAPMSSHRTFTVSEANALLPRLNLLLEAQMRLLADIDARIDALRAMGASMESVDPKDEDSRTVLDAKAELRARLATFRDGWREVEATGAVVKDMRRGLLDFYGHVQGTAAWLCWRYGEPSVGHWHPLDQGFSSRKPLPRTSIPPTLN